MLNAEVKNEVCSDQYNGEGSKVNMKSVLLAAAVVIVYTAMGLIETRMRRNPIDVFDTAMRNATPVLEVKPRRVGGSPLGRWPVWPGAGA